MNCALTIGSLKHKNRKVRRQGFFVHIQLKFAEKGQCFYFVVLFINTPLSSIRMLCGAVQEVHTNNSEL